MSRLARLTVEIVAVVLTLAFWVPSVVAEAPPPPDEFDGLEAWYRVEFAEGDVGEKNAVHLWPDRSGKGHDLVRDGEDRAGTMRAEVLNGHPVVDIEVGRYQVKSPFELADHTIFVVARAKYGDQALFRGGDSWSRGILLYQDGRRHVIRIGGVGTSSPPYSEMLGRKPEFLLHVLGRNRKVLRSWIDGSDLSSWMRSEEPLEVGAMFHMEMSQFVDRSGKGLEVAEMLFYNRYLDDEERHAVSAYLASKYGLRLRESVALTLADRMQRLAEDKTAKLSWLTPRDGGNLNEPDKGHRLLWAGDSRKRAPFRHEEGEHGSRIYCTADGTKVYFYLSLPLEVEGSGARLRALILLNGKDYHQQDEAETAILGGTGPLETDVLELETELELDSGDYIEVIVFKDAGPGTVKIGPDPVGLILERR